MRLMDGVSKVIAKLLDDLLNLIELLCSSMIANDTFEAVNIVSMNMSITWVLSGGCETALMMK